MSVLDYQYIAKLVTRTMTGDSDAFAELYAATYQRLYHFAYHYLKDEYLAQDALQETYILVLKNIHSLKNPELFISWLNQICFRICFNMQKKNTKHKTGSATMKPPRLPRRLTLTTTRKIRPSALMRKNTSYGRC